MQISGRKNIAFINKVYSPINSHQHRQISQILHSNSNDKRHLSCLNSNTPSLRNTASVVTSDSKSDAHVSDCFQNIFNAPIYGGTFNINVHQDASHKETTSPKKRRLRCIDNDSDYSTVQKSIYRPYKFLYTYKNSSDVLTLTCLHCDVE